MEDVEKDGSSLVCKDCGRMQPDTVLRKMVAEAKRKSAEKAMPQPAAQEQTKTERENMEEQNQSGQNQQ